MMLKAARVKKEFRFKRPATTSRGALFTKQVTFIVLFSETNPSERGIGECSLFSGLSADDVLGFDAKVAQTVALINSGSTLPRDFLVQWPSIGFALETARADLACNGHKILYPSEFTSGKKSIPINGLIWMDTKEGMKRQIARKLEEGFGCLKFKIGAIDFEEEFGLLSSLRREFGKNDLELRVDANGAFSFSQAAGILEKLASLHIHSIEQPIKPLQYEAMASLCRTSPVPIALDEELIGVYSLGDKRRLLKTILPQYIILKPGLLGGIRSCEEWISAARELNIGWWITSSLETNIGLNAIAQWTFTLQNNMRQGLSTGNLFEENIVSPLALRGDALFYSPDIPWNCSTFSKTE